MDAVLARTRMNLPQRFFAEMIAFAMHRSCVSVVSCNTIMCIEQI